MLYYSLAWELWYKPVSELIDDDELDECELEIESLPVGILGQISRNVSKHCLDPGSRNSDGQADWPTKLCHLAILNWCTSP